jgi:hypothetical protein
MKLKETKEQYMNDQLTFELAMHRVQAQAKREGKNPNFGELLELAKQEVEREYERNVAIAASLPDDA